MNTIEFIHSACVSTLRSSTLPYVASELSLEYNPMMTLVMWESMARKALAIITIILGASISIAYLYYAPSHLTLSIADPPPNSYSNAITGIYINVSEIDIHASGAGNSSGWTTISRSISINLMSVLSTSKVLGTTNLPPGRYDQLRFFASQAIVTLNGTNTTYTIPSGGQSGFKVEIANGGFHIYGGQTMTVQLDLSFNNNEIMNNPNKTLTPVASAIVVQNG